MIPLYFNDAAEIYRLLEEEIIPAYYDMADDGTPRRWAKLMKASIKASGAKFSARRMVKEYIEKFYRNALKDVQPR